MIASGRESQEFKIKTKRSQSKKNQPTYKGLTNTNSLVADSQKNKLIILPVSEPTYLRGKSATQSIVNLA